MGLRYLYGGRGSLGGRTVPVRARRVDGVLPGERGGRGGRARLPEPRQRDLASVRLVRNHHQRVDETGSGGRTLRRQQRRHVCQRRCSRRGDYHDGRRRRLAVGAAATTGARCCHRPERLAIDWRRSPAGCLPAARSLARSPPPSLVLYVYVCARTSEIVCECLYTHTHTHSACLRECVRAYMDQVWGRLTRGGKLRRRRRWRHLQGWGIEGRSSREHGATGGSRGRGKNRLATRPTHQWSGLSLSKNAAATTDPSSYAQHYPVSLGRARHATPPPLSRPARGTHNNTTMLREQNERRIKNGKSASLYRFYDRLRPRTNLRPEIIGRLFVRRKIMFFFSVILNYYNRKKN